MDVVDISQTNQAAALVMSGASQAAVLCIVAAGLLLMIGAKTWCFRLFYLLGYLSLSVFSALAGCRNRKVFL